MAWVLVLPPARGRRRDLVPAPGPRLLSSPGSVVPGAGAARGASVGPQ